MPMRGLHDDIVSKKYKNVKKRFSLAMPKITLKNTPEIALRLSYI